MQRRWSADKKGWRQAADGRGYTAKQCHAWYHAAAEEIWENALEVRLDLVDRKWYTEAERAPARARAAEQRQPQTSTPAERMQRRWVADRCVRGKANFLKQGIDNRKRIGISALSNFLRLGLTNYAEHITTINHEHAITLALYDLATNPDLGIDEGTLLAKLWDYVAFSPPKKTTDSNSRHCWQQVNDPKLFLGWARLCQAHRDEVGRSLAGSRPSWTGGLELSEDQNKECFALTMQHILEHELTAAQRQESHYHWDPYGKKGPSRKARSLHDAIVRKYLGHKKTAHHIYQHGLPRLFDAPLVMLRRENPVTAAEHRGLDQPTEHLCDTLQAPLAEAARWLIALACAIRSQNDDAHMPVLHMLSTRLEDLSLEQLQERQELQERLWKSRDEFARAKMLVNNRDSGKRKFDNMSPSDHDLVKDFDTQRVHKRRNNLLVQKLPTFRSHVSSMDAPIARPSMDLRQRKFKRQRYQ